MASLRQQRQRPWEWCASEGDPGQPLGVPHLIARLSPRSPFCELATAQQRNNKTAANTSWTLSISAIISATSTTVETQQPCRRHNGEKKEKKSPPNKRNNPPAVNPRRPEGRREPRRDRDVYRSVAPREQPLDILKAGLCQCHCHGRLAAFPTTATTARKDNRTTGCDEQRTGADALRQQRRASGGEGRDPARRMLPFLSATVSHFAKGREKRGKRSHPS